MSFPRYPKYKKSGVEWLGEVPEHWDRGPLKRYWNVTDCKHVTAEFVDDGIPLASIREVQGRWVMLENAKCTTEHFYQLLIEGNRRPLAGDLIFSRNATVGEVAQVRADHPKFAMGQDVVLLRKLSPEYSSDYLQYVIRSQVILQQLANMMIGSTFKRINVEEIRSFGVPVPPAAEQAAIAEFLDRETEKIDALVAEQQRLIELLKEKRQAVISHAVTKGLNPHAPMRPSGIEWLGDVPAHWRIASLRRLIRRIEQGWSPECIARPAGADEWGVLKSGCVNRGILSEQENKALPDTLEPIPQYEVRPGDVLMSRASGSPELVGSTAYITEVRPRLMLSDKIFRIHLEDNVDPEFYVAVLNSSGMRSQIERAISGAEGLANNLPQSSLKAFFCAVPPTEEQQAIVRHLTSSCASFDALTAVAQQAIGLLQERRTALISAAVTGHIDVRHLTENELAA